MFNFCGQHITDILQNLHISESLNLPGDTTNIRNNIKTLTDSDCWRYSYQQ